MEALILVALVIVAVLILSLAMSRLRFDGYRRLLPPWIPAVMLALVLTLLVVAVLTAFWWNAVTLALLAVLFGAMLLDAVRRRRAAGS